jgi:lysophospholipase L1-like esterase
MFKSLLKIFLCILPFFFVYLFIANWSIFYRLEAAGLPASDYQHRYLLPEEISSSSSFIVYSALGDSLTAGTGVSDYQQSFPYRIAQKLADEKLAVKHLNYSYPGARTSDIIKDLLGPAIQEQPDVVTILIGINDVYGNVGRQNFAANYELIISSLQQETEAKINIISIPLLGSDSLFLPPLNYYYRFRIQAFNKIIKNIATQHNLNYIDLTTPTASFAPDGDSYYAVDNFHPSAAAYELWSQIIYDHLTR